MLLVWCVDIARSHGRYTGPDTCARLRSERRSAAMRSIVSARRAGPLRRDPELPMNATIWIVILVPLLLFGWLMAQVMPTPRDRQLTRLRNRARALGIGVGVSRMADPDPDAESRVSSSGEARSPQLDVAVYSRGFGLPAGIERRHVPVWRVLWMRNHADETMVDGLPPGWRFERPGLPLVAPVLSRLSTLLTQAPRGTISVEGAGSGCSLGWRERGAEQEIEAIRTLLDGIVALQLDLARDAARREPDADASV